MLSNKFFYLGIICKLVKNTPIIYRKSCWNMNVILMDTRCLEIFWHSLCQMSLLQLHLVWQEISEETEIINKKLFRRMHLKSWTYTKSSLVSFSYPIELKWKLVNCLIWVHGLIKSVWILKNCWNSKNSLKVPRKFMKNSVIPVKPHSVKFYF